MAAAQSKILKLTEFVTANDLAIMMNVPINKVIATCMNLGVMVSIAGFMSSPFFSVYAATKAALKIFIESINVELEKAGSRNRILNVSPGKVRGTKFHDDDTDIERVTPLAKDIISHLESGDDLFIPLYNEVYRQVLERYHNDFRAEGRHSYEYKQNISSFNPEGSLLRRQQHRMTEMLLVLDDICRRHGIRYWLAAGTLLGAVRHKGYIPWDDDLDIEMLREDYDRLLRILPKELPEHLQLQTPETDAGYFLAYAKLRDRRSRLSETNAYDRIFEMQGIFIDIFPMERVPSFLRWVSCRTIGRCYKVLKRKNLTDDEARRRVRRIYEVNRRFIFPILNALSAITPFKRKIRYSLGVPYDDIRLDKWLFPLTTTAFEGHQFPVPANCEAYLTSKFGNWRQLPDLSTIHAHAAHLEINE